MTIMATTIDNRLTRFDVNLIWAAAKEYKLNEDRIQLALRLHDFNTASALWLENDRIKNHFFYKYKIIIE